ncbi:MAG: dethiobiotin synthase [Alcanivoracaceae bacterium]|uniref:ATP-dependent dethiobiotin synthetase BioD n=1 Tax=Alcanivorax profundi TaxID=2338368 RepID=A0A418XY44_9GAMM|nr:MULTISPECIES: dethiobiotin synthase [Alcanivorax]MAX54952.1 dethiobiotin synthase [Alcanivoracaceae bacterium]MCG8437457.1 dethiobiotin synthase [Pseudomonadales bacterium]MED5389550.1 dethiobiotin synthase [Pseudomonadota bacterium]ERP90285.1 dithiobiotin synthetase [Alcanivorax sp. P2S70]MEE2870525.1 dethiobiotin synthase [Pseudomonadota bacterium]|tara:strand:- start:5281 stop:5925 length:645 start_codon:yes stop_codon:yes gene_type:complete
MENQKPPLPALKGIFFVTGTDTEVGKTWVSCRLLERAREAGLSCYGLKPIAAGCEATADGWQNEDALQLMAASSVKLPYETVNPVALKAAIAPHIAAQQEGKVVTLARLAGYVRGALNAHKADLILIEGAGGWRVPLNDREMLSGLAKELALPVIQVVGMKLGCISHALLTAEAIEKDGLQYAGTMANCFGDMDVREENLLTLRQHLPGAFAIV